MCEDREEAKSICYWTSFHDETLYPGLDVRLVTQSAGQDGPADKRGAELETAPPTVTPRG